MRKMLHVQIKKKFNKYALKIIKKTKKKNILKSYIIS